MTVVKIPATYMRGGTSKGVFFRAESLPSDPALRDQLLLRVIGSPDPYGNQLDGMGGATSSTSKVVIVSTSKRQDCDVDYLFGQVAIDAPVIDWSGNCGNLTAAVGPFAIQQGLISVPADGIAEVGIWQANIGKRIVAHVPIRNGEVIEEGSFRLDGVAFPAAPIKLEFLDPGGTAQDGDGALFPTGNVVDTLNIPGIGELAATLINAGNPTIFIEAAALGLRGIELPSAVNNDKALLERCEAVRSHAAVRMGLADSAAEATRSRPHTPKLTFIAAAQDYLASGGRPVGKEDIDVAVRILSMGKLHHAITGTGAVALAVAAVIPGTVVQRVIGECPNLDRIRLGHPSGTMTVGADASSANGMWAVTKVMMTRSARQLMSGWVSVPQAR